MLGQRAATPPVHDYFALNPNAFIALVKVTALSS
jgi:hypothetical protein